jgi:hypothetical protein
MKVLSRGALAAILSSLVTAAPAAAVDVTVRVEGADRTVVPEAAVTLPGPAVDKRGEGGTTCAPTSAGAALEAATGGNWGGRSDAQGQRLERIGATTYPLGTEFAGRYWAIYVNDRPSSFGICRFDPQQADEVLVYAACGGATTECFAGEPLDLDAPRRVRPGEAFDVSVQEVTTTFGPAPTFTATTTDVPSAQAAVTGEDVQATTGTDGRARVALTRRGDVVLTARKGTRVPESRTVCVTDGADGFCGTSRPGEPAPAPGAPGAPGAGGSAGSGAPAPGAPACVSTGGDGLCGTADREAPKTLLSDLREGAVFARGRAPRVLRGRVGIARRADFRATGLLAEPSGVRGVALRLTRTDGGRCTRYDFARERFVRAGRCGARGPYATVGDRVEFEYQLAAALPRGRYVLDARATDRAGNADVQRRRGENRVVFRVR